MRNTDQGAIRFPSEGKRFYFSECKRLLSIENVRRQSNARKIDESSTDIVGQFGNTSE
ncbi:hypothetical protein LR1_00190 [Lacticaseibacillus rhamnosus DSM 20021 = JCM 1136 = NBRC 3425]|nr:hypothetical protein LR1_00190 [Lacticaseibacillus rhamnosus DSM 20021 = JCM 1136 = NBRC 3425]